jgi:hypothetical protein
MGKKFGAHRKGVFADGAKSIQIRFTGEGEQDVTVANRADGLLLIPLHSGEEICTSIVPSLTILNYAETASLSLV